MKLRLFVFLGVIAMAAVQAAPAFADGPKIEALNLLGSGSVVREGKTLALEEGMLLKGGDQIITGDDSQVDVVWDGVWGYRLLSNSDCVLKSAKKGGPSQVDMMSGNIILNVQEKARKNGFKLQTPVAVAAVRGTKFWGRVLPVSAGAPFTLAVLEGLVQVTVKATGEVVNVGQGQAIDVDPSAEGLTLARNAKVAELNAMKQAYDILPGIKPALDEEEEINKLQGDALDQVPVDARDIQAFAPDGSIPSTTELREEE